MPAVLGNLQGLGEAVGGVGKTVIDLAKGVKSLITGKLDPQLEAQIDQKWLELENAALQQQNRINEIEAASSSRFVSSWRPATGWVCVSGLAFEFIIRPLVQWILTLSGSFVILPQIDLNLLFPLLAALLGIGTMRSVEKIKGVQNRH